MAQGTWRHRTQGTRRLIPMSAHADTNKHKSHLRDSGSSPGAPSAPSVTQPGQDAARVLPDSQRISNGHGAYVPPDLSARGECNRFFGNTSPIY
jgi:hypothetical protein